jgi:hypothetical protein
MTRQELTKQGVTRATLRDNFTPAERGVYVGNEALLPETTDSGFRRDRRITALQLTIAHLLRHPKRMATGFGAASLYRMTSFVNEEILEFLAPHGTDPSSAPAHILVHPTRHLPTHLRGVRHVTGDLSHLRIADPGTTLSYMLHLVSTPDDARSSRWRIPDLTSVRPHLTPEFIRCVQSSDAFHHARGRQELDPLSGLMVPGGVDADLAARVLGATDLGAESPMETRLRLVVADLAPGLRSQIPVFKDNGNLLTISDLGWEDHGLHLFYDGEHHLKRSQRDKDSKVLAALQRDGGRVIRVVSEDLKDADAVAALRDRIIEVLE